MGTLELIKALPAELREQILKEYIKNKLKEREDMGWDVVNDVIKAVPVCEKYHQIVRVLFCYKCKGGCRINYLCGLCHEKGNRHYLGYPIYDENDYPECVMRSFT